jgi:ribosomal protein L24E
LDHVKGKCRRCHYTMCPPGQYLSGCSNDSPGKCESCPNARRKPRQGEWITANDPSIRIQDAKDTCKFTCPNGTIFDSESTHQCIRCDPGAPQGDSLACRDGQLFSVLLIDE